MLSPLLSKVSVGFRDVDWAVEQKKSQRGLEWRKKERQRRAPRKTQRRMSNEQLKSFLQSGISPKGDAEGNRIIQMNHCGLFLQLVEEAGFVAFPEGSPDVEKVRLSLEKFDNIKDETNIISLIQSWMYTAIEKGLYQSQPEPSSLSSGGRGSSVSGLTDGTFEPVSLSSHNIDEDDAAAITQAAVFAAYAAGKHRDRSHKLLCNDFSKIFQTRQPEYISAMATAEKKTDWTEFHDGGVEASVNSRSSITCIDELASAAHRKVAEKVDELGLTKSQIEKLMDYCFIPLQQH